MMEPSTERNSVGSWRENAVTTLSKPLDPALLEANTPLHVPNFIPFLSFLILKLNYLEKGTITSNQKIPDYYCTQSNAHSVTEVRKRPVVRMILSRAISKQSLRSTMEFGL